MTSMVLCGELGEIWMVWISTWIISKDIDDNFFWFTITGQQSPDESGVSYPLNVGQIMMKFK